MSLKYRDKNGAEHVLAGLTPGGDIEYGAVATRKGTIEVPGTTAAGYASVTVTFGEPMPDAEYEVNIDQIIASNDVNPYTIGVYDKTANGFKAMFFNPSSASAARSMKYTAYKLYEVADAEALYSEVTDIKAMIPSSASSTNKFATANDLRSETRSLDRRLDDVEDVIPTDATLSNKLVTEDDLSNIQVDSLDDINDVDVASATDGQALVYNGTTHKWENGQGGKTYSAGNGINISGTDEISTNTDNTSVVIGNNKELKVADTYKTTFVGSSAEWEALSATDKAKYKLVSLTDDAYSVSAGHIIMDKDGNAMPARSNLKFTGQAILTDDAANNTTIIEVGYTAYLTVNYPETTTCTLKKDGTVIGIADANPAKFTVDERGTFTVEVSKGDYVGTEDVVFRTMGQTITVTLTPPAPTGSSITPVNDIATWLYCGGIWNKNYTTISQVLGDSTTLLTLINSNNASDYLVRSTSWSSSVCGNQTAMSYIGSNDYCANDMLDNSTWRSAIVNSSYYQSVLTTKIPTMTSNTTPSGVASSDTVWSDGTNLYYAYRAMNGNTSQTAGWIPENQNDGHWLQYKFTKAIRITAFDYKGGQWASTLGLKSFKVMGSNDGSSFVDLTDTITNNDTVLHTKAMTTKNYTTKYQYVRVRCGASSTSAFPGIAVLQVYGR